MTLEPPITQRDIDDAVTFRTRGGGTARISTNCTSDYFPWVVEFSDAQVFPMTASGSYCICGCCNHSRDLISRIPEPAIESQVVDGCCPKHGRIWVTDGVCRLCKIHNAVNHPPHYTTGSMEVIDAIEGLGLGFHEGNIVKYVARAKHKGSELEDLKKAAWYLSRRIQSLEEGTG